jgi:hypothetical protein
MINVETREIDGHNYEFYQLGAVKSLKILTRILKIIGEPIGLITGEATVKDFLKTELNSDILGKALKALTDKLDEELVVNTIKELLEPVLCDGKRIQFDLHFQGRIGHLLKVVKAALEVNYKDFFGVSQSLLEGLAIKAHTQSTQTT